MRIHAGAHLALAVLAACGEASAGGDAFVVRDSAGIVIVESAAPAWEEGEGLRLSEEPLVEIGMLDGPEEYQLFRVTGALRLLGGGIAVANSGTHEVRFYDVDGRFLAAAGREGEGPGEFRGIRGIEPYRGDSLVVLDSRLQRLTVLAADGSYGRDVTLQPGPVNPRLVGTAGEGSFLLTGMFLFLPDDDPRDLMVDVLRYDARGAFMDTLAQHLYYRAFPVREEGAVYIERARLAPITQFEAAPGGYVVGEGQTYEVARYRPDGALERIDRWRGPDRTVTSEHEARYREDFLANIEDPGARRLAELRLERVPFAEARAAYRLLVAGRDGSLWLREREIPGEEGPARWDVLASDGRWLGPIEIPSDLRVLDVGSDWLLALRRDELGIERVQLYALETSG